MITEEDVYTSYKKARSLIQGKPYKLPKDWEKHFTTKLSLQQQETIIKATGYFNTTWSNINIDEYMITGFELFKTFSYHSLLNPKILAMYIEKDKQKKRRISISKELIIKSFDRIKERMEKQKILDGYTKLQTYCKLREGDRKVILFDYIKNLIDPLIVVYCIYYKYLQLSDTDKEYVYNISTRYRELLEKMFEVESFIKEGEKL